VKLQHWARKDVEYGDYAFARFNKKVEIVRYTDEEYRRYLAGEASPALTVCTRFVVAVGVACRVCVLVFDCLSMCVCSWAEARKPCVQGVSGGQKKRQMHYSISVVGLTCVGASLLIGTPFGVCGGSASWLPC